MLEVNYKEQFVEINSILMISGTRRDDVCAGGGRSNAQRESEVKQPPLNHQFKPNEIAEKGSGKSGIIRVIPGYVFHFMCWSKKRVRRA